MRAEIPKSELFIIKKILLNAIAFVRDAIITDSHELVLWVLKYQDELQFPDYCLLNIENSKQPDDGEEDFYDKRTRVKWQKNKKDFNESWKNWTSKFRKHVNLLKPYSEAKTEETAKWIGKLCDLPENEIATILLLALSEKYQLVRNLIEAMQDRLHHISSSKNGIEEDNLQQIIGFDYDDNPEADDMKIMKYGIIESKHCRVKLNRNIRKLFLSGVVQEEELKNLVIGESRNTELKLADFEYLGQNVSTLKKILKSHKETNEKPLNIFLYGEPGTGKTEFAKAIGADVGRGVYFIGEQDEENKDVTRSERVSALMLLGGIKDISNSKILVVDEADEILSDIGSNINFRDKGSKIFLNRLLEKINTPIIWIVNDHNSIDNAVLRRMNYCLEFPKPPLEVRKSIIAKIANDNQTKIGNEEIAELAKYEASPAYFENAIRLSQNIDGDLKTTQQILENNLGTSGRIVKLVTAKDDFKIELSNANMDLLALRDQVKSCNTTKLTFCFSGVPGTGKSEYARYLAKELGYEILYKRYSDLSSKWLGETEKNIANAFREASQKKAFLIIDEADSLLQKRENAVRSWEVTQVNEFLTQIESHEYPFAITTNAFDNLDTAAMRRFLFKVKFTCMEKDQIEAAFQYFFEQTAPHEILRADGLTPADFALVRNQAKILGISDRLKLSEMLIEETSTRGMPRARIGF